MQKIYGYKEKDVIALANQIKNRTNQSLSDLFREFAKTHGKSKGTVRNLYYALAKRSNTDAEFCKKYLDGKPISVSKIVEFNNLDERALIKKILTYKLNGKSVRSAVMDLANGDGKLALRYQNKFRNIIKNKKQLVNDIVLELKADKKALGIDTLTHNRQPLRKISDAEFSAVKDSIDSLIFKISEKERKENAYLKERVSMLEMENIKLNAMLYGDCPTNFKALDFFKAPNGKNATN